MPAEKRLEEETTDCADAAGRWSRMRAQNSPWGYSNTGTTGYSGGGGEGHSKLQCQTSSCTVTTLTSATMEKHRS